MEQDLQQQVAELLAQQSEVTGLDRLKRLVGFLEQVTGQRLVGLFGVPRAAARRAEPVHHLDGTLQLRHQLLEGNVSGCSVRVLRKGGIPKAPTPRLVPSQVPYRGLIVTRICSLLNCVVRSAWLWALNRSIAIWTNSVARRNSGRND